MFVDRATHDLRKKAYAERVKKHGPPKWTPPAARVE